MTNSKTLIQEYYDHGDEVEANEAGTGTQN